MELGKGVNELSIALIQGIENFEFLAVRILPTTDNKKGFNLPNDPPYYPPLRFP